ncbi:MAG TPA: hypothetical protein VNA69_23195 [Thermoanaerobaculia bacterium]|nr:hypothetical protein [Thermoanaerobaculia bacterium]
MRALLIVPIALLAAAPSALAQCKNILQGLSPTQVTMALCPGTTAPAVGQTLSIEAGGGQFQVTVATADPFLGQTVVNSAVVDAGKSQENLLLLSGINTATVKFDSTSISVAVQPADPLAARNSMHYHWAIGPATKGDSDGDSFGGTDPNAPPPTDANGAIRLRYAGDYARGGVFGFKQRSLWQTSAGLAIDTTDQDAPDFIDNNSASLGVNLTNLSFGRLWMHGKAGVQGKVQKAVHHDTQNVDGTLTVSGWVPVLRSFTLFSKNGEFIAAPLSFSASYGYRNHHDAGESYNGRVFDASVNYNLFLFDQYSATLTGTWTVSDLTNRPATTPRTQKMFKATVAYLANPQSGFKVLTSFESGSAGVMLKEVRQYFVGIAVSRLNLGGKGGG